MTLSTSEVAVCRSRDSVSSRVRACTWSNNRTFSIAITAGSAKVEISSICLSVNGFTARRNKLITPMGTPSRSSGTPSLNSYAPDDRAVLCPNIATVCPFSKSRR
jgi:hypothetical protein